MTNRTHVRLVRGWVRCASDLPRGAGQEAMTTKFPLTLILLALAKELAAQCCELGLTCIRRETNQLADDLTTENFEDFILKRENG